MKYDFQVYLFSYLASTDNSVKKNATNFAPVNHHSLIIYETFTHLYKRRVKETLNLVIYAGALQLQAVRSLLYQLKLI